MFIINHRRVNECDTNYDSQQDGDENETRVHATNAAGRMVNRQQQCFPPAEVAQFAY